jgi:hypothetical protein
VNVLTHCKAMEAFCRQRSKLESEAAGFWLDEAQLWRDRQAALAGKTKPKLTVAAPGRGVEDAERRRRPLKLPQRRQLVTPNDAVSYLMKLPKAEQKS